MDSKITFLSQFPPNKGSGVGDYCGLLYKQLNEKYDLQSEIKTWNNSKPNWQSLLTRQQKTSILSIQFVPYSFGRWGFFLPFLKELVRVKDSRHIHIMFHEIWIGDYPNASIKERLIGRVQKFLIKRMIKTVKPIAIHTTNEAYMNRLKTITDQVQFLPLFGNIPFAQLDNDSECLKPKDHSETRICFFASIYDNDQLFNSIRDIVSICSRENKKAHFVSIGSIRTGSQIWNSLKEQFSNSARFTELGKISESDVSKEIQKSDFGITTTDLDIIGKSGATMAMLEHGLSVILTETESSQKVLLNNQFMDQLIYPSQLESMLDQFIQTGIPPQKKPHSGLEDTTKIFYDSIKEYL